MKKLLIIFILGLILLSGCGQQTSPSQDFERIKVASSSQIERIEFGLVEDISITKVYTIKSEDFSNVYFVGGLLSEKGINNGIGIWSTGGYEQISMIFSTNSIANQFSDYPLGENTKSKISMDDEGAYILEEYLKK